LKISPGFTILNAGIFLIIKC